MATPSRVGTASDSKLEANVAPWLNNSFDHTSPPPSPLRYAYSSQLGEDDIGDLRALCVFVGAMAAILVVLRIIVVLRLWCLRRGRTPRLLAGEHPQRELHTYSNNAQSDGAVA